MKETMTSRGRWLAALGGEQVDRLPFWPKLDAAYPPGQTGRFSRMGLDAIHDWIGSDKHKGAGGGPWFREIRTKTSFESHRENGRLRQLFHTPARTLEGTERFDEGSRSWHPVKMPVAGIEDLDDLSQAIIEVIDEAGAVRDAASPKLQGLRRDIQQKRES